MKTERRKLQEGGCSGSILFQSRTLSVVSNQRGGTGNKLFVIAAGIALSHARRLPLVFRDKVSQTMASRGFPCLRTSRTLRGVAPGRIRVVQPNLLFGINFQDVSVWFPE